MMLRSMIALLLVLLAAPPGGGQTWTGAWATAPAGVAGTPEQFTNETLRLIVHTSAGGEQVRVTISNTFGAEPLVIGAAHVARRDQDARTRGAFDAVIDFDKAVRDPARPARILPAYDGGDHLHPSDAGMAAMAAAIPLDLFRK
jgi:hypothetical protein